MKTVTLKAATSDGVAKYEVKSESADLVRTDSAEDDPDIPYISERVDGATAVGGVFSGDADKFEVETPAVVTNHGYTSASPRDPISIEVRVDGSKVATVAPTESYTIEGPDASSGSSGPALGALALLPAVGPLSSLQTTLAALVAVAVGGAMLL